MSIVMRAARQYAKENPAIAEWIGRFASVSESGLHGKLRALQFAYNAPLLLAYLDDVWSVVKKEGIQRVLFQSRDGCLAVKLWNVLHPEVPGSYFYVSRECWRRASTSFREYHAREATGKSLLVDFISAGLSVAEAIKSGVSVGRVHAMLMMDYLAQPPAPACMSWMTTLTATYVDCATIEMLNYDLMGQVLDVSAEGVPVCEPTGEYSMDVVRVSHEAFGDMLDLAPSVPVVNAVSVLDFACQSINEHSKFLNKLFPSHVRLDLQRAKKWHII